MLEDVIIIGIVMAFMELAKKYINIPKEAYFLPILILAAGLNYLNAYFFNGVAPADAVLEGIKLGAAAAGIFGLGKAALGKS